MFVRTRSLICSTALLVLMAVPVVWLICAGGRTPSESKSVLPNPYAVEVVGRDFVWAFRSPGPDGRLQSPDDVLTEGQFVVPSNADVELRLTSSDFIYTFRVPELNLSEIAVPEMTHRLAFRVDSVGTYEVRADPMCGLRFYHDDVMARMFVRSPEQLAVSTGLPPGSPP